MTTAPMTLFYSVASPFVRQVMLVLHETGQLEHVGLITVQPTPVTPAQSVLPCNPSGKIPALTLADGNALHDSRVILEYLDTLHAGTPLIPREGPARWRRLTLLSLADTILDAAVLVRYETLLRPLEKQWDVWQDSQREKIRRALACFESAIGELNGPFDIAAIGLASALGYLDFRNPEMSWRDHYPHLATWYADISQRPSMLATRPAPL